jgi:hypothetical protein
MDMKRRGWGVAIIEYSIAFLSNRPVGAEGSRRIFERTVFEGTAYPVM